MKDTEVEDGIPETLPFCDQCVEYIEDNFGEKKQFVWSGGQIFEVGHIVSMINIMDLHLFGKVGQQGVRKRVSLNPLFAGHV